MAVIICMFIKNILRMNALLLAGVLYLLMSNDICAMIPSSYQKKISTLEQYIHLSLDIIKQSLPNAILQNLNNKSDYAHLLLDVTTLLPFSYIPPDHQTDSYQDLDRKLRKYPAIDIWWAPLPVNIRDNLHMPEVKMLYYNILQANQQLKSMSHSFEELTTKQKQIISSYERKIHSLQAHIQENHIQILANQERINYIKTMLNFYKKIFLGVSVSTTVIASAWYYSLL